MTTGSDGPNETGESAGNARAINNPITRLELGRLMEKVFIDAEAHVINAQSDNDDETKAIMDHLKLDVLVALQNATRSVLR